jgi:H+/gluconate symporter-like permease
MVMSGFTGFLAAIGIISAYFIVGSLIGKLLQ